MRQAPRQKSAATAASADRRVVRTRRALRDALAEEIEVTGDLSQVTVTAVSDRAGITRRTFYSHYRDISDLVSSLEERTIDELRSRVARLSAVNLDELQRVIARLEPAPGAVGLLEYFRSRPYLSPLLGEGGDPAFAERIKLMVREVVQDRALDGLDLRAIPFFDYYLTFVISAEVGVLARWLSAGMREDVGDMARVMTALLFVRPGDLYGKSLQFDVDALGLSLLGIKESSDD